MGMKSDEEYEEIFSRPLNSKDDVDEDCLEIYDVEDLASVGILYDMAYEDCEMPACCEECGNPNYPECSDDCAIYDNQ